MQTQTNNTTTAVRSKWPAPIGLVLIAAYIVACAIGAIYVSALGGWTVLQTYAIMGAGLIYLWYTVEAWQLRLLAQEQVVVSRSQVAASIQPIVIAEPMHEGVGLRNVGTGPALDVVARPVSGGALTAEYRFDEWPTTLAEGERLPLTTRIYIGGEPFDDGRSTSAPTLFNPKQISTTRYLVIDYKAIDGRKCSTTMEMSNTGYRVVRLSDAEP